MKNKIWRNSDFFIKRALGVFGNCISALLLFLVPVFIWVLIWGTMSFFKANLGISDVPQEMRHKDFVSAAEWTHQSAICIDYDKAKFQEFLIKDYILNKDGYDLGDYCILDTGKYFSKKIKYFKNNSKLISRDRSVAVPENYNFCIWTSDEGSGEFPTIFTGSSKMELDIFTKNISAFCQNNELKQVDHFTQ
jgi:hypothetical protein